MNREISSVESLVPPGDLSLPRPHQKASFASVYSKVALYDAVLRVYTKPLFYWQKALSVSHDGQTLYDFARHGPHNVDRLHTALLNQEFHFRAGIDVRYTFNRKRRTIYLFPWEERIVDQLLFQALNKFFHPLLSAHSYAYRHRGLGVDLCQHRIARALGKSPKPVYLVKRDISNYFPSIDHDILLRQLEQWVEPDDYLSVLLRERVKFRVRTADNERGMERGVPFGTSIACLFCNVYLTPLDYEMASVPGLTSFRYADDILALSHSRETAVDAAQRIDAMLARLKLGSKATHEKTLMLAAQRADDGVFTWTSKFRHLGLEFRSDGSVGLSRDKAHKIRNLFRFAFRRAEPRLQELVALEQRVRLLIEIAKQVIEQGIRSIAIIDYYLKHIDDEEQLRQIDRWLAEEVLARALQTGHRKGNFARLPFKRLRQMGLPSLRHRRRLLRHGIIKSSFLALRIHWLMEEERRRKEKRKQKQMEMVRKRLPGLRTFSPSLKAAANTIP